MSLPKSNISVERMEKVSLVKKEHESALLRIPGVIGVGIGAKDNEPILVVLTSVELENDIIPDSLDDVSIVVEVTGYVVALKGELI